VTVAATRPAAAARPEATAGRRAGRASLVVVALAVLAVLSLVSLALGSRDVGLTDVLEALTDPGTGADATVIREMRVPRTLLAIAVGAALALSGALLQGVARNPLADPGVLGINAGAAAAVVAAALAFGLMPAGTSVWFAFAGAGAATVTVYAVAAAGRRGATPVTLALAGAALTALCTSATSAIVLADPDALEELRMWQVGALSGRYAPVLAQLAPYLLAGIVAALLCGRVLNLLSLGDEMARALGVRVGAVRAAVFVVVAVLCGAATAACGPIVFVGLMVPHLARLVTGPDYRWILVTSAVLGPVLVLGADIVGRVLVSGTEVPVGVVVGILGAPVFVLLVRLGRLVEP
jgi:iron complex transport system permease protein